MLPSLVIPPNGKTYPLLNDLEWSAPATFGQFVGTYTWKGKHFVMKVTLMLRNDHAALQNLFSSFRSTRARGKTGRRDLLQEIHRQIIIHSRLESEIFYPALSATKSDRAGGLVSTAQQRNRAVQGLLQDLLSMNPSDENFSIKMDLLMDEVSRHIAMDEEEMFHEARRILPDYLLEELGIEMQRRKNSLRVA